MKRSTVMQVKLDRLVEDEDPEDVGWYAEWGIRDDSAGTEDSAEDLRELVAGIASDVHRWTHRYDVTLEWVIGGDAPEGSTVEKEIARLGVTLPRNISVK
ncbi:hypothetical protein HMPREF3086_15640 [Dietzia sp. HMSC21D01]|uniref:hypothetical protein n=1 Tax=Dietzia TaxID=37914 RepID=UPI0008A23FC2|nr:MULTISPECIES: hypothetical protein [Dietzia]MCT2107786.1 hypothetical protein [Dietzia cinnamea]OFS14009.1 hypothetical protein HMPREF3086_15640 [Dietzia sp. HMSC21D01]